MQEWIVLHKDEVFIAVSEEYWNSSDEFNGEEVIFMDLEAKEAIKLASELNDATRSWRDMRGYL